MADPIIFPRRILPGELTEVDPIHENFAYLAERFLDGDAPVPFAGMVTKGSINTADGPPVTAGKISISYVTSDLHLANKRFVDDTERHPFDPNTTVFTAVETKTLGNPDWGADGGGRFDTVQFTKDGLFTVRFRYADPVPRYNTDDQTTYRGLLAIRASDTESEAVGADDATLDYAYTRALAERAWTSKSTTYRVGKTTVTTSRTTGLPTSVTAVVRKDDYAQVILIVQSNKFVVNFNHPGTFTIEKAYFTPWALPSP